MSITRLICTECGEGHFRKNQWSASGAHSGYAVCDRCQQMVSVPLDILPYADGATLDVDESGYLVSVTGE